MATIVLGAFEDQADVDAALQDLGNLGYMADEISVISAYDADDDVERPAKHPNWRSVGAGAIIGGIAGLIATLAVFPVLTGILIGGPLIALLELSGAAAGAVTGDLIGALTRLGLPEEAATRYHEIVNNGGIVLGASGSDDLAAAAQDVFEQRGAEHISVLDTSDQVEDAAIEDLPNRRSANQPVFGERRDSDQEK